MRGRGGEWERGAQSFCRNRGLQWDKMRVPCAAGAEMYGGGDFNSLNVG
jgi:hypothetical protein